MRALNEIVTMNRLAEAKEASILAEQITTHPRSSTIAELLNNATMLGHELAYTRGWTEGRDFAWKFD